MAVYEEILVEHDGPLSWIILNRPERFNAISTDMLREFDGALTELSERSTTRVIAIRGAGNSFSSGYDVQRDHEEIGEYATRSVASDRQRLERIIEGYMRIWRLPKPVIAAVQGYCLAGATQLATLCDITVVSHTAQIGLPSIPLGGGFISPMWVPLVGPKRAKQLSFQSASRIDGVTATEWGWANYSVEEGELFENVRTLAFNIARTPRDVLTLKKASINRAADISGWSTVMPLGAETDALLHQSDSVRFINSMIMEHGLKAVLASYQAGEYQEKFDSFEP